MAEFWINSQKHYRLVKDGSLVEVYEYGPNCPCPIDSEKKLLGKIPGNEKVCWNVTPHSPEADDMDALVAPGDVDDDIVWCGDDFIAALLMIKHKAALALLGK